MLNYLAVPFTDRQLDLDSPDLKQADHLEATFNSGFPVLDDQSVKVSDSIAISIHICNKYGARGLLGKSLQKRVIQV